jgi:hypothetical protein
MESISLFLTLIVSSIITVLAIALWCQAAYKAFTLWKEQTKRNVLIFGIGIGIIMGFCYLLYLTTFSQVSTDINCSTRENYVESFKNIQNYLGSMGVFYALYHSCMFYIKIARLTLTQRLGNKMTSRILLVSNVVYLFPVAGYSLLYCMMTWHPESIFNTYKANPICEWGGVSMTLSAIHGIFGVFEVLVGGIVELGTIFFLRSVIFGGRKGYNLKDLGFYEYAAVLTAALVSVIGLYVHCMLS